MVNSSFKAHSDGNPWAKDNFYADWITNQPLSEAISGTLRF